MVNFNMIIEAYDKMKAGEDISYITWTKMDGTGEIDLSSGDGLGVEYKVTGKPKRVFKLIEVAE